MSEPRQNQKRTAIVYFGSQQEDYLKLVQAENRREFMAFIQQPLQAQLWGLRCTTKDGWENPV
jgi:hypothetical protein